MKSLPRVACLLLLTLGGCKGEPEKGSEVLKNRCVQAIDKSMLKGIAPGNPSTEERDAMDAVQGVALSMCLEEGLSAEQLACFEAISDVPSLLAAADCPAIAGDKKPSWFRVAPPEQRRAVLEKLNAKKALDAPN